MGIFEALVAIWAAAQTIRGILRQFLPSAKSRFGNSIEFGIAVTFLVSTTILYLILLFISFAMIEIAISANLPKLSIHDFPFLSRTIYALLSFSLAFLSLHFLAYCFGGYIKVKLGQLWPRGIDYVYYLFGALLLLSVIADLHGEANIKKRLSDFKQSLVFIS